ncbi:MAG: hypothetical protein FJ314_10980 [SAR202 cluster bacterium]|nr:hypothetical protein [SAR202 cluster bacterium]
MRHGLSHPARFLKETLRSAGQVPRAFIASVLPAGKPFDVKSQRLEPALRVELVARATLNIGLGRFNEIIGLEPA